MKRTSFFFSNMLLVLCSCINSSENNSPIEEINGKFCADIEYFNPNTSKSSSYQLFIEIEENFLVKIYWPNGGWLDESHFDPPEIIDSETSFVNDNGYEYDVTIGLDNEKCHACYERQEEYRIRDSIEVASEIEREQEDRKLEIQKLELEIAELESEMRLSNMGSTVLFKGCKDLFIFEYSGSYIIAQKIGYFLEIDAGDKLDCDINVIGITSVGNLTNHSAGNIDVIAIKSSRYEADNEFDNVCREYMKTWTYN